MQHSPICARIAHLMMIMRLLGKKEKNCIVNIWYISWFMS